MAAHVHSTLAADIFHMDLQGYVAARTVGDLWYVEGDLVVGLHQLLVVTVQGRGHRRLNRLGTCTDGGGGDGLGEKENRSLGI